MKKIAVALAMMVVLLFPSQAVAYGDQGVPPNNTPSAVSTLPDTGGASKGILAGGVVLVIVGGVIVALVIRRRR